MRMLPNALALARAAAVLPVVLLIGEPAHAWWALAIFSAAALTDALDGPLARRINAVTPLGTFLDPLADKILILGALAALLGQGHVEAGLVLIVFGRELLAVALRSAGIIRGVPIEVSAYGKAKTVAQAVAVGALLLSACVPGPGMAALAAILLAGAVVLTIASGVGLLVRAPLLFTTGQRSVHANAR
jgi:CDP-diacylglycerol--glycerol-3-phosphate 3-phosphatidyltransferase